MRIVLISVFVVAGLMSAGMAWASSTNEATARTPASPTAILDAQRLPALLAEFNGDQAVRNAVAGAMAKVPADQNCAAYSAGNRTIGIYGTDKGLVPASTLKILTATAALEVLGADTQLRTEVKAANTARNGILEGPLYLVGGGDPLLTTDDYNATVKRTPDVHTSLEKLADQVAQEGVRSIRGSVVGDDTRFDQMRYSPDWDDGYRIQGQVGPVGALQVNQGFERFANGRVGANSPTLHAAALFTEVLKEKGVSVTGLPASGMTPPSAKPVTAIDSPPVKALVAEMLTESDNTTAEMLIRDIGVRTDEQGTLASGLKSVISALGKVGVPLDGLEIKDGSGLDRNDRATCQALLRALVINGPDGPIADGLARAGQTGTLFDRMVGTEAVDKVRAKTGTLSGISALSGWIRVPGRDSIAFAILNNGVTSDAGRNFEDSLTETVAGLPATPAASVYAANDR